MTDLRHSMRHSITKERRMRHLTWILCILILTGMMAFGQDNGEESSDNLYNPSRSGGLKGTIQFTDVDNVNLFNGNLNLTVPIGPSYRVGPLINFQLRLYYNTTIWRRAHTQYLIYEGQNCPMDPPYASCDISVARDYKAAYGIGWDIHMGRMILKSNADDPGTSDRLIGTFQSADGSEHNIYYEHLSENRITRDGSFLRLFGNATSGYELQDGMGIRYRMHYVQETNQYMVERITDPYGNYVEIGYLSVTGYKNKISSISFCGEGQNGCASALQRVQFVYTSFIHPTSTNDPSIDPDENVDANGNGLVLQSIKVLGRDGLMSQAPTYNFNIHPITIPTRPGMENGGTCYVWDYDNGICHETWHESVSLPFLEVITLPDYTDFHFNYCTDSEDPCVPDASDWINNEILGRITSLGLPTGGSIDYEFQTIVQGEWKKQYCTPNAEDNFIGIAGIKKRILRDSDGSILGHYEYIFSNNFIAVQNPPSRENAVYSTDVRVCGDADPNTCTEVLSWQKNDFYPGIDLDEPSNVDCSDTTSTIDYGWLKRTASLDSGGQLLKETINEYAWDNQVIHTSCNQCTSCGKQDSNVRVKNSTINHYLPGNSTPIQTTSTCRSELDSGDEETDICSRSFGHYKMITTKAGDCQTGTVLRSTYTEWTPDPSTWLLNRYSQTYLSPTEARVDGIATYYDFNSTTGFLQARCQAFTSSASDAACDTTPNGMPADGIRTIFIDQEAGEPSDGLPTYTAHYRSTGGDPAIEYRTHDTYEHGVLKSSVYQVLSSGNWSDGLFYVAKQDINPYTLLPERTYDTTGELATQYEYDSLFRVKKVLPPDEYASSILYQPHTDTTPYSVAVYKPDTQKLSQSDADGLGRVVREHRTNTDDTESYRCNRYDTLDRPVFTSTWTTNADCNQATVGTYTAYDTLGRPTHIWANCDISSPADCEETFFSYEGTTKKTVTRFVNGPNATSGQPAATVYSYDLLGRLDHVTDALGNNTYYSYDLQDHLTHVEQHGEGTTQTRDFSYDNLGNLLSEDQPELTFAGSGHDVSYGPYDSVGNLLSKRDAQGQLWSYQYDSAGRPTLISVKRPTDSDYQAYQEFEYDGIHTSGMCSSMNNPFGYACGKLIRTLQFPLAPDEMDIQHQYYYNDAGGRLSKHEFNSNFLESSHFVWGYTYDDYGLVDHVLYPVHVLPGQSELFDQYLDYDYQYGLPVSLKRCRCGRVDGQPCDVGATCESGEDNQPLITGRSYHPGGMPYQTDYANGIRESIERDPITGVNRPFELSVFQSTSGATYWDSGPIHYDGMGNIMGMGPQTAFLPGYGLYSGASAPQEIFQYDRLSRLVQATSSYDYILRNQGAQDSPANHFRDFIYDDFGNLLENGPHDLNGSSNINASFLSHNRLGDAVSADYDTGGNLTEFGDYEYEYDSLNRLRRVTHGVWRIVYPEGGDPTDIWEVDGTMDSWYDANGERVGTCDRLNQVFTMYLRDEMGNVLSEYRANACPASPTITSGLGPVFDWRQDYYYFDGKLGASESLDLGYPGMECEPNGSASDIYFYHSDHLGSPRIVSRLTNPTPANEYGFVKSFHVYWPYGEEITNQVQDQFTHRYTGHERDFATNLDYMHARYYSPLLGRLLSIDPNWNFDNINNPKYWNRYEYATSNPIINVDLNGKDVTVTCAGQNCVASVNADIVRDPNDQSQVQTAQEFKQASESYWNQQTVTTPTGQTLTFDVKINIVSPGSENPNTDTLTVIAGPGRSEVKMKAHGPDTGKIYTVDTTNNQSGMRGISPHETGHLMGLRDMYAKGEVVPHNPTPQGDIMRHAQPGNSPITSFMVLRPSANFNTKVISVPVPLPF
ncbi:MAG TPA: RHS repeat-associated core domain-containing protein [Thermoanaerobaculia bacterium]|nr:RHS repeat-associated core domain-containing protein [Thermoanaerobaculia bacterium]HUM31247.1 RHS repeat-associated core domain-containing protein [Thermoanaerobaculia bacterium]HXK69595.1 RHS repeat-associated core domain-containing protein [Thermoanaerobaculia bacterium]